MIVIDDAPSKIGRLDGPHAERIGLLKGITRHGGSAPEEAERFRLFDAPVEPVGLPRVPERRTTVEGPHGSIPVRLYLPEAREDEGLRPAFVWIHGGAFIGGDIEMPEAHHTAARVAAATGIPVISVDYRLCNETVHHPVPHDDCFTVYQWVRDSGHGIPTDPERVGVGGASAGACLAAGVGVHGRDIGEAPASLALIYPLVHSPLPACDEELASLLATLPPLFAPNPDMHSELIATYLGPEGRPKDHPGWAMPGWAEDLSGIPRTFIENCEFDELRASGELFGDQLRSAGCEVEMRTVAGEVHGHLNVPGLPSAKRTCARISQWLEGTLR